MKTRHYFLIGFLLISAFLSAQITITRPGDTSSSSCNSCSDPGNDITNLNNNQFRARPAQAYFWEICEGNATITGSNTTRTIQLSCPVGTTTKIKLTRFQDGNCIESCEIFTCDAGNGNGNNGGGGCEASSMVIGCQDSNGPFSDQYPTLISIRIFLENPFDNPAVVNTELSVPGSGFDAAGAIKGLQANEIDFYTEQYMIIQSSNPLGLLIPLDVIYTDTVTGAVCIVSIIAEWSGECNGAGGTRSTNLTDDNTLVYPNPYEKGTELTISSESDISNLALFDSTGIQIGSYKLVNNKIVLDGDFNTGLFFLKYEENGEIKTTRLIIK